MNSQNKQGFTIIEVVLVLAIAGLIFLMVFIALPALQRGQRDTARKNDISTVTSALNTYRANNKGSLNGLTSTNLNQYVDNLNQYAVDATTPAALVVATGSPTASKDTIQVVTSAQCPTTAPAPGTLNPTLASGTTRQAAVITALENNGTTTIYYCQSI